ncbi:MAG: hypothetical protein ACOC93_04675 [Planctomycetota bacterium]
MATMSAPGPLRRISFAITVGLLVLLAALLAMALLLSVQRAGQAGGDERDAWTRLALLCMALLALTLVLLVGVLVRRMGQGLGEKPKPRKPTPHMDAWSEAGRRIQLPDEDDSDDGDPSPPDRGGP